MQTGALLLSGIPASGGIATGPVRIIPDGESDADFAEGSILVTRITDPSMVMIMARAAAIVCDIGGLTSHPSIVSREMGIPCVVGTVSATSVLKDGQSVTVDGNAGTIHSAI